MAKLTFKTDNCKGCGLCVDACPLHLLRLASEKINKKGHHPAEITDESKCVGCASYPRSKQVPTFPIYAALPCAAM